MPPLAKVIADALLVLNLGCGPQPAARHASGDWLNPDCSTAAVSLAREDIERCDGAQQG